MRSTAVWKVVGSSWPSRQGIDQAGGGGLALADIAGRAQDEVHPGLGRGDRALAGGAEGVERAGFECVGDGHALEAQAGAQLGLHHGRRTAPPGELRSSAG